MRSQLSPVALAGWTAQRRVLASIYLFLIAMRHSAVVLRLVEAVSLLDVRRYGRWLAPTARCLQMCAISRCDII